MSVRRRPRPLVIGGVVYAKAYGGHRPGDEPPWCVVGRVPAPGEGGHIVGLRFLSKDLSETTAAVEKLRNWLHAFNLWARRAP